MSRVLFVDDDATQLRLWKEILEQTGLEVMATSSVGSAESIAIAAFSDLDLIVTDHMLSGATGADLIRRLRDDGIDVPVIVLTGLPDAENEYVGLNVCVLHKPVMPSEVLRLADALVKVNA